jgi:dTDP-4-amino-4,6-dideoxygalactose transaminase
MILMNNFKAEPSELKEAMLKAVNRVLESGRYILGDEVLAFESKWATSCGVTYGVGVGNGMDATEISLRALNIGIGDEVITTSMTAFATVLAILRAGATPVLADIDSETGLLSIESAYRCITSKTKALLLVHLYGQVRQMTAWTNFCNQHGIILLEDCAQAHLATLHGKVAGSFGEAGSYSFYPTKNLGTIGDGGMLVTNNYAVASKAEKLRNYGQSELYKHPELGMNSRLDEIHAAILIERLKWLPKFTERRRQIALAYQSGINNPLIKKLALPEEECSHVYYLYVVTCEQRELLQAYLKDKIQTLIHYPICIHNQIPCINIKRDPQGLSSSEKHAATCLSLPCNPQMSDENIASVISYINSFRGS